MNINWEEIVNALSAFAVTWGLRVVGVIVALIVAWAFAGWVQRTITKRIGGKLDVSLVQFFASLLRWAIIAGAVVGCMGVFGIETASFAALVAAMGLAIGLAFQGTLSNFSAGVMLLVFRPFKVGDVVNTAGQTGKVDAIDLFTTEMTTPDNRRIIIPNKDVFGATIDNYTYHKTRRVDIAVGTDYGADLRKVREVLEAMAPKIEGVLADPPPQIFLAELGGSSIDWAVRVWCKTEDYWTVHQATILATKEALDEAGIGIPFPQQDVHLDRAVVEALAVRREEPPVR